jgi:hypothetical protein
MSDSQATLAERRASRRIGGGARGEADGADASDASPLRLSVRIPSLLDDGEAKVGAANAQSPAAARL